MATVICIFLMACNKKTPQETVPSISDSIEVPSLRTLDVNTLISDSGVTRFRLKTKEWVVYENPTKPYWYFPRGILVEKFDSIYDVEAYIEGDTAIFLSKEQLWELKGNVKMMNLKGEKFLTEQIFWSQKEQRIYSDKFIHIQRSDRIIEGYGFESNEPMTKYVIKRTQGTFPIEQKREPNDSTTTEAMGYQNAANSSPNPPAPKRERPAELKAQPLELKKN